MTAFDLDPSLKWLFCLTHPDDEISIAAWIKRLTENGNEVHLSWTHSTAIRESEARNAAKLLGVPGDRLWFFAATDGSVCQEIPQLMPRFQGMISKVSPDRIVCGAFEQGHIDHDATNFLVNQNFQGPVLEVPLYHTYAERIQRLNRFSNPSGVEIRDLTKEEQTLKKNLARSYPSQRIWSILLWYEIGSMLSLRPARLAQAERLRFQTHDDWMVPNHPAQVARRVMRTPDWRRWTDAIRTFDREEMAIGT